MRRLLLEKELAGSRNQRWQRLIGLGCQKFRRIDRVVALRVEFIDQLVQSIRWTDMHVAFEPLRASHPRWHHDGADLSVMAASVVVPQIPCVCMCLVDRRVVRVDLSLELENHDAAAH